MQKKTLEHNPVGNTMGAMSTVTLDQTLSVKEAASRLRRSDGGRGVDPSLVLRLIQREVLVAIKRGRDWVVDAESVERYMPKPPGNPNFQNRA